MKTSQNAQAKDYSSGGIQASLSAEVAGGDLTESIRSFGQTMSEASTAMMHATAEIHRLRSINTTLLAALLASEREYENLDEAAPVDSGCIECTVGTVPNNKNTGLCAHHLRVAAIKRATGAQP